MTVSTIPAKAEPSKSHDLSKGSKRPLVGLVGIFLAAMMAGLNNRVAALALPDIRGALAFGFDDASWLGTVYNAGELIAMPFAAWFAITLSVRRFELWMLALCTLLAFALPFIHNLNLLLMLRFLQGVGSGTMIPVLMMAALKFLPPPVRLHGLALYAMTATFAPNLAISLAGYWTDQLFDWRWVYWQLVPVALVSGVLIAWGLPREPIQTNRFSQGNWAGMFCGVLALGCISVGVDQGVRLDWLNSPLIASSLLLGMVLLIFYLLTEWYHPTPFIKLQILSRWNLCLGFTVFLLLLLVLMSGALPGIYLGAIQQYRPLQSASLGFIVALPQVFIGSIVALLLYQRWVDARIVFSIGLCFLSLACFSGARLNSEWIRDQFVFTQVVQAIGQPLAIIPLLFLCTSVVQAHDGPYVSGTINALRAFGSLVGAAFVAQLTVMRSRYHSDLLLDHAMLSGNIPLGLLPAEFSQYMSVVAQQSLVLSIADVYRVLGYLALLLIPLVLRLNHVPAPVGRTVPMNSNAAKPTLGI